LRNLPFLKELPGPVFDALVASGALVKCTKGEVIWTPPVAAHVTARGGRIAEAEQACAGPGIYIIMAGLVKSSYIATDGHVQVRKQHLYLVAPGTISSS
jgi:hypothetical protein